MFDAVIFDLDGTLIDTESLALASGIEAFASMGQPVDEAFMHGLVGKDLPTGARIIAAAFPELDLVELDRRWTHGMKMLMDDGLPLKPGVEELLARLTLPRAIATSSGRDAAHAKIGRTGLAAHFEHIVTYDDVTAHKPFPDPYLLAARLLGVDPARCVVFEDSDVGAEAAHAAGMHVIQVPDVMATEGRFAHLVAEDLLSGAIAAGVISA